MNIFLSLLACFETNLITKKRLVCFLNKKQILYSQFCLKQIWAMPDFLAFVYANSAISKNTVMK